jgi:hypothetical protein
LCSSVNVKRQVSHPHKTADKIKVLNILISKREDKRVWTEWSQVSPKVKLFLIFFVNAIPICKCRSQTSELVHFFKGLMLHSVDQTRKYTLFYFWSLKYRPTSCSAKRHARTNNESKTNVY